MQIYEALALAYKFTLKPRNEMKYLTKKKYK